MHMQVHLHKGKGGGEGSSTGACRYSDLIGKLQEITYTSPCSADTTELVLAFIWQVLCPFKNHAIYLCYREFAPWQNGSVVSSMATQCKCGFKSWIDPMTTTNVVKDRSNQLKFLMDVVQMTVYAVQWLPFMVSPRP